MSQLFIYFFVKHYSANVWRLNKWPFLLNHQNNNKKEFSKNNFTVDFSPKAPRHFVLYGFGIIVLVFNYFYMDFYLINSFSEILNKP